MTLSSRERLLLTLRHQEPDYVPLLFRTFGVRPPAHLAWANQVEEARVWRSLGVDAWLTLQPPMTYHPDVRVREWLEAEPGGRWPVMVKEYDTPAGPLRQEVYRTEDWVTPDWPGHRGPQAGVQLFDDYNVPQARSRRFAVESEADIEKLKYLLYPPSAEAIAGFREQAAALAQEAQELGVMLVGWGSSGTDAATWLCGVEGMLELAIDQPDVFSALLDVIHEWDRCRVELLLETPVDMVIRRGFYEGTTFWSPTLYRRFFAPRIKQLVEITHQASRYLGYIISVGVAPLLDTLVEIGYDAHYLLDPIQNDGAQLDMVAIKARFGKKIAVIGGLNEPITMEHGTREDIRREVFRAVRTLGPGGGLALCPVEAIVASTPWQSVEAVIEAWKEVRQYPLQAPLV